MSLDSAQRPYSKVEQAVLLLTRALTATLLTAFVGAVGNWIYERFFAPDLYETGSPMARGIFMFAVSFPFILAGLILFGLPVSYALRRFKTESAFTYSLTGAVMGLLWSIIALEPTNLGLAVSTFYGCFCALCWWWLRPR